MPNPARLATARAALSAGAPAPDSFAVAALRAAGLTPPFERRFLVRADPPVVAGFVAGGHPAHRDTLVVALGLGPDGGAALLEAARLLSARSAYVPDPPRTVLAGVVFTARGGAPATDAVTATTDLLGLPLWSSDAVVALVVVGPGAAGATRAASERGLEFLAVEPQGDLAATALAAHDALVAAAWPTTVPDTLEVPR